MSRITRRRIGDYSEPIVLMIPDEAKSATGAPLSAYAELGRRWAAVVPRASREFEGLRQRHQDAEAAYIVPGRIAVTGACRVVHDGQTLEIVGIETENNRTPENAEEMTLICKGRR